MQKSNLIFIVFEAKGLQHISDDIVNMIVTQILQRVLTRLLKIMFGVNIYTVINVRMSLEGIVGKNFPPPPLDLK